MNFTIECAYKAPKAETILLIIISVHTCWTIRLSMRITQNSQFLILNWVVIVRLSCLYAVCKKLLAWAPPTQMSKNRHNLHWWVEKRSAMSLFTSILKKDGSNLSVHLKRSQVIFNFVACKVYWLSNSSYHPVEDTVMWVLNCLKWFWEYSEIFNLFNRVRCFCPSLIVKQHAHKI